MNEQRLQAYDQLIENLLNCPSGEEPAILAANTELLDAGFLEVLEAVAENFSQQGEENVANRLSNLANQLSAALNLPPTTVPSDSETNAFPQDWALTQYHLGNAYYERILGERAENLESEIAAFSAALEVHTNR